MSARFLLLLVCAGTLAAGSACPSRDAPAPDVPPATQPDVPPITLGIEANTRGDTGEYALAGGLTAYKRIERVQGGVYDVTVTTFRDKERVAGPERIALKVEDLKDRWRKGVDPLGLSPAEPGRFTTEPCTVLGRTEECRVYAWPLEEGQRRVWVAQHAPLDGIVKVEDNGAHVLVLTAWKKAL